MFIKETYTIEFDKIAYPLALDAYAQIKAIIEANAGVIPNDIKSRINAIFSEMRANAENECESYINSHHALKRVIHELYTADEADYEDFCYAYSKLYPSSEYLDPIRDKYENKYPDSEFITYLS